MLHDDLKMTGTVELCLTRPDGSEERQVVPNLVTSIGKQVMANRIGPAPTNQPLQYMALGTGGTPPNIADAALQAEIPGSRTAITVPTIDTNVMTHICTFPPGVGTGAVVEAGLFNHLTLATMWARAVFAVINKQAEDSLKITWNLTVG